MALVRILNPTDATVLLRSYDGDSTHVRPGFKGHIEDKFMWQFPDHVLVLIQPVETIVPVLEMVPTPVAEPQVASEPASVPQPAPVQAPQVSQATQRNDRDNRNNRR